MLFEISVAVPPPASQTKRFLFSSIEEASEFVSRMLRKHPELGTPGYAVAVEPTTVDAAIAEVEKINSEALLPRRPSAGRRPPP